MARQDVKQRQRELLELMTGGATPKEAAAVLRISDRSVRRYLSDPVIVRELQLLGDERLRALSRLGLAAASEALTRLQAIAGDGLVAAGVRARANRSILDVTLRLHESVELADRLQELERTMGDAA